MIVDDYETLAFLARSQIYPPFETYHLLNGRNSEVIKIRKSTKNWVLKKYPQISDDPRDRLSAEFKFLTFLKSINISNVPTPIDLNQALGLALYTYLPGEGVVSIEENYIDQCVEFISNINKQKSNPLAKDIPLAAGAHLNYFDCLKEVNSRLIKLQKIYKEFPDFILFIEELIKEWHKIESYFKDIPLSENCIFNNGENSAYIILSPSDFGFHNILLSDGKLYFLDFEYAGWDNPIKLICDFICQPDFKLDEKFIKIFLQKIINALGLPKDLEINIIKFLPVYRVKWACIILASFSKDFYTKLEKDNLKFNDLNMQQFEKAKKYFLEYIKG